MMKLMIKAILILCHSSTDSNFIIKFYIWFILHTSKHKHYILNDSEDLSPYNPGASHVNLSASSLICTPARRLVIKQPGKEESDDAFLIFCQSTYLLDSVNYPLT